MKFELTLKPVKGETFQYGEVWFSPRGVLWKVVGFAPAKHCPQAILRLGAEGTGRKRVRDWDKVQGWSLQSETCA